MEEMLATRKYLAITAAVATIVTLSACSGGNAPATEQSGSSSSQPSANTSAVFNGADITFAQAMVPHHEQAVAMSDVVLRKDAVDQRVLDLATQIKAAQEPEIEQLNTWLTEWGADSSAMEGMDGMGGTMSQSDMDALDAATGNEASRLFLEQMVKHHQGAIEMAQTELDQGKSPDAKKMAETIVNTQSDEISVMKDLLATL